MHKIKLNKITIGILLSVSIMGAALAEDVTTLPEMTVESEAGAGINAYPVDLESTPASAPDTTSLLRQTPGGGVNRNGPLTAQPQYRGMFADRIDVSIDGMYINSGGPNGMDPALSYIPRTQLESLKVIRGIAPVSSTGESIGGSVIANSRKIDFTNDDEFTPSLSIGGGGESANSSWYSSALAGFSNDTHRIQVFGSHEEADDIEFPGGDIVPTEYERDNFGAGYGFHTGSQEFGINVRRNETGKAGTPALPMDIKFINTSIVEGTYNSNSTHAKIYWSDVNHEMGNFFLRMPPNPVKTRLNMADSSGWGYSTASDFDLGASSTLTVGIDGHLDEHDSTVIDPINNPAFRVTNFNNVKRDLYGFFLEWNGTLAKGTNLQIGTRYNKVDSDAGKVSHFMAMMNPAINRLQTAFNTADRSDTDNNIDVVAKLSHAISNTSTISIEAGRKLRSPSYQERYLWIPLQATNGLADGNNYVGNLNLNAEKSYELGLGLDSSDGKYYAEPRVFYRFVDDYIQGTPATNPDVIAISSANGDTTPLKWNNVDARFYGLDAAMGVRIDANWSVDGMISYVRGKRDDISDDLYRIAPLNGRATLIYRRNNWWGAVEGVIYADQDKVSRTNNEAKTDGYGLIHLRAGMDVTRTLKVNAGIENLFNNKYEDHLAGINRVTTDTDVAAGDRLPGAGRSFLVNLTYDLD